MANSNGPSEPHNNDEFPPEQAFYIVGFDQRKPREKIYKSIKKYCWIRKFDLPENPKAGLYNKGYAFVHTCSVEVTANIVKRKTIMVLKRECAVDWYTPRNSRTGLSSVQPPQPSSLSRGSSASINTKIIQNPNIRNLNDIIRTNQMSNNINWQNTNNLNGVVGGINVNNPNTFENNLNLRNNLIQQNILNSLPINSISSVLNNSYFNNQINNLATGNSFYNNNNLPIGGLNNVLYLQNNNNDYINNNILGSISDSINTNRTPSRKNTLASVNEISCKVETNGIENVETKIENISDLNTEQKTQESNKQNITEVDENINELTSKETNLKEQPLSDIEVKSDKESLYENNMVVDTENIKNVTAKITTSISPQTTTINSNIDLARPIMSIYNASSQKILGSINASNAINYMNPQNIYQNGQNSLPDKNTPQMHQSNAIINQNLVTTSSYNTSFNNTTLPQSVQPVQSQQQNQNNQFLDQNNQLAQKYLYELYQNNLNFQKNNPQQVNTYFSGTNTSNQPINIPVTHNQFQNIYNGNFQNNLPNILNYDANLNYTGNQPLPAANSGAFDLNNNNNVSDVKTQSNLYFKPSNDIGNLNDQNQYLAYTFPNNIPTAKLKMQDEISSGPSSQLDQLNNFNNENCMNWAAYKPGFINYSN